MVTWAATVLDLYKTTQDSSSLTKKSMGSGQNKRETREGALLYGYMSVFQAGGLLSTGN